MDKKNGKEVLEIQAAKRIRQGILVVPSSRVYNALDSVDKIDWMYRVGHCGDGYETTEDAFGRRMINVPIMMGGFLIEREAGVGRGIMGGNLWFLCESEKAALSACDASEEAMKKVDGVVLSFRDGCSAGSKAGGSFSHIGPTTYHNYCPTLHGTVSDHKVPAGVTAIPEVIINGMTLESVKAAMKAAIGAVSRIEGVRTVSAGNYGGKLGRHQIRLRELV
jgi:formylmethanofuran--tetrahydromethanopterin N-formyltransferase